jgi:hypothetical protein
MNVPDDVKEPTWTTWITAVYHIRAGLLEHTEG